MARAEGQGSPLRSRLALATTALLGTASSAAASSPVQTEANVLYYSETDRIDVVEAEVSVSKELREDERITVTFLFDSLTGPSPNGATPASVAQTFTTASGKSTYVVRPGDEALDPQFHDTRFAGTVGYARKWGRFTDVNVGGRVSAEHDYLSLSASAGISRDLNERNTTLSAGLSFAADQSSPEGGIPTAWAEMAAPGAEQPRDGSSDSRTVLDAVFGVTQVFGRTTIGRINYSVSASSGYLTDPYKLVSVLNGPGSADAGDPLQYLYESRPDSRLRHSIYAQLRQYVRGSILDGTYRFYTDDWGVTSHTATLRYRQPVASRYFVQPQGRYYTQGAADIFTRFLVDGQARPDHASADPRLSEFDAYTLGLKAGMVMADGHEVSFTVEWYRQFDMRGPPEPFGTLVGLPLWSEAEAIMFRVAFGHDWSLF